MNDETWDAVCDSLKTHPTLEVLDLCPGRINPSTVPSVTRSQVQALLDMMKMNMSIHTIHLHLRYSDHARESVIPYLETNRLRSRVRAIQKNTPDCVPCQGSCWDAPFLLLVLMQIAFGCFYQEMPKLLFYNTPQTMLPTIDVR
jgi:hypothetical protein